MSYRGQSNNRRGGSFGASRGRGTLPARGYRQPAPRSRTPAPRAGQATEQQTRIPAVDFKDTYHVDIMGPYSGETGAAFVKRGGARLDLDLIDPPQMANRLSYMNYEGFNRPGRALSFLGTAYGQGQRLLTTYEKK